MRKIKRYKEFINEEITADLPPKAPTEIHIDYEKPVDKYSSEDTYVFNPSDTIRKTTKSKSEMEKMVKYQHWTLDSTSVDTLLQQIIVQRPDTVITEHSFKFDVDGDLFLTGKFQLSQQVIDGINSAVDSIKSEGGIITDFQIESSTDKEPIEMKYDDKEGNDALAQKRADAVKDELIKIGVDESIISITTKPEQGPDIYSKEMNKEERDSARLETSDYRYVTISIIYLEKEVVFYPGIEKTVPKIKHVYHLSKVQQNLGTIKMKPIKQKKTKSNVKKVKRSGNKTKCEDFGNKGDWWNNIQFDIFGKK